MAKNSNDLMRILKCKCPKCHQGNLFSNESIFKLKGFLNMADNCSKCNQDFQIEAGFYLGAMFVSYALTVAIIIAVFVIVIALNSYELVSFLITIGIILIITTPLILKISRSIWISFSVRYDPNAIKNYEAQHKS